MKITVELTYTELLRSISNYLNIEIIYIEYINENLVNVYVKDTLDLLINFKYKNKFIKSYKFKSINEDDYDRKICLANIKKYLGY